MVFSTISIFLSLSTKSMTHPVSFMAVILAQTLLVCLITSLCGSSSWFAFILFLIFMGGVMVLFIYMSSLASNENFLLEPIDLMLPSGVILLTILSTMVLNSSSIPHINFNTLMITISIFSYKFSPLMIFVIFYLLISMLIVSNIVKKNKAPIRSMK